MSVARWGNLCLECEVLQEERTTLSGIVAEAYKPGTQEAEAGGPQTSSRPASDTSLTPAQSWPHNKTLSPKVHK